MIREELANKSKKDLTEIAKSLGVKGTSKLTKEELIEHIMLLDPPFAANPEDAPIISHHLDQSLNGDHSLYKQPPIPEHLTKVATYGEGELDIPSSYNETRIALMVRDPYWLYAYWDINTETKNKLSQRFGGFYHIPLCIRVYDITDISFDGSNSNYYFDVTVNNNTNSWYINVGKPNRSFCVDLGFIQPDGTFFTIARSNAVTTPRDNVSDVIDEEWMLIEENFKRLYRLAGLGDGNSSIELVESLIRRLEQEMSSGTVSSLSSPVKYEPRERQFWLALNTELIIYGATEPNANITVQGEPIQLRPDGTFTLRFALPDGCQRIPVVAQSADGIDTITITPIVTKETK